MVASMTAFARQESNDWIWEVRSVNHRYLDISFSLPKSLQSLEPTLLNLTRKHLTRGRIDASLSSASEAAHSLSKVNDFELAQLLKQVDVVADKMKEVGLAGEKVRNSIDLLQILHSPGVLAKNSIDTTEVSATIADALDQTLVKLKKERQSEGLTLLASFESCLAGIKEILHDIAEQAQSQLQFAQSRIHQRIEKLGVEVEPQKIAAEVALMAQKADVKEEIDRLNSQIVEFENCLDSDEPHGRRLGFIVQEMGRESNTLATKLLPPESVNLSVNLKVLIDQIREQVQNVE